MCMKECRCVSSSALGCCRFPHSQWNCGFIRESMPCVGVFLPELHVWFCCYVGFPFLQSGSAGLPSPSSAVVWWEAAMRSPALTWTPRLNSTTCRWCLLRLQRGWNTHTHSDLDSEGEISSNLFPVFSLFCVSSPSHWTPISSFLLWFSCSSTEWKSQCLVKQVTDSSLTALELTHTQDAAVSEELDFSAPVPRAETLFVSLVFVFFTWAYGVRFVIPSRGGLDLTLVACERALRHCAALNACSPIGP